MNNLPTISAFVGSGITLLAILVALFRDEIRRIWQKPSLAVTLKLGPPDCHKTRIDVVHGGGAYRSQSSGECYYLRLWIENRGNIRADRVQVFISRLLKRDSNGTYRPDDHFLPMNLCWSHNDAGTAGPEVFADGISPHMGKHCDLGHILHPDLRKNLAEYLQGIPPEHNCLVLDLEVKPNTQSHLVPPGNYRLELKVAASNARPVIKTLDINLEPQWYPDEPTMFTSGIVLHVKQGGA